MMYNCNIIIYKDDFKINCNNKMDNCDLIVMDLVTCNNNIDINFNNILIFILLKQFFE